MYRNNNGKQSTKVSISNYYSVDTHRVFEGLNYDCGSGESNKGIG